MPNIPSDFISPEVVEHHKAEVAKMEAELDAERQLRRQADGEIIKLRATLNGVDLKQEDIEALMAQQLESAPPKKPRTDVSINDDDDDEKDQFDDEGDEVQPR